MIILIPLVNAIEWLYASSLDQLSRRLDFSCSGPILQLSMKPKKIFLALLIKVMNELH